MGTFARLAEPHATHRGEPGRLAEEHAALRRVATLVAAGAPPTEVFDAVTAEVAALIPADGSALTRYEADGTFTPLSGWAIEGGHKYIGRRYQREGTVSGLIFETGRPGRVDNYAEAPGEAPKAARELAWHSSVGAPITVEGRLWGALVVVSKSEQPLPLETERRLAEFTELVATAIANGQAHDELTRLAEEQAALRRVATLVAAGASPAEVFEAVSTEVAALIHADGSALTRYEEDGTVSALSGWTSEGGYTHVGTRYPLEGTVSGVIFETGRPGRVDNYAEAPGQAPEAAREMGWHSSVGAPITVEGRLWGALAVASRREKPLPPDAEQRLAAFTELVATAIANSEAHQELARLADEQAALRRVATLAAQGVAPGEVFEAVSAEVAELIGADAAGVTRYEADGTFTALGGWTSSGGYSYTGRRFPLEGSVSGLVLETRRPSRIDDFEGRAGEAAAAIRELGWRSAMGAPISVEGSPWGVLVVYSKRTEPLPSDTERRLGEFTEIVATAIANAEGREEINRLAEVQAALRRVATLVAEGGSPAAVFEAISGEVGRLVPADVAGLSRFAADGTLTALGSWTRSIGPTGLDVGLTYPLEPGTAAARVFATREPARIDSYDDVAGRLGDYARKGGWRSSVGVPVLVDGALWGLVIVGSMTDTPLPPDTEARLTEFTELLATAIANAESRAELTQLAEEQATLRRVATLVAEGATPNQVFSAVRDEVARLLGFPLTVLLRYDADGMMTLLATSGEEFGPAGSRWRIETPSIPSTVLKTRRAARMDAESRGPFAEISRRAGVRSAVGVPVVVDGLLWGLMATGSREPALPRDTEARLAKFTELLATAIANAEGREALRVRSDEQAALRRVATLVARGVPAAEIFDAVASEVVRLLGADWAAVHRVEPDGAVTVTSSSGKLKEEIPVGTHANLDSESLIASVMRTGGSRLASYEDTREKWAARARALGVRSAVGAPITVERRLWGVMVAVWTEEGRVPVIDAEARMANFTELVGTAIANAEGRAELDASRARIVATADATRRRIERDLHDGAQQQLVSLALEVRAAQAGAPEELSEHRDDLSHIAEGLTTVLDGLREIALGIHPAILAEGGLGPALKTLAHRSPIPVGLDVRNHGRLPEPVEVAAYYVVSESLTNAAKHSRASKVQIDVETDDRALRVTVRDDGDGGADPALGSGLLGLKDRAEAMGGTITLESRRGAGTTLTAELPLDRVGRKLVE